ncbi:MAG: hypothetical protein H8Z69_01710 [Nanohaloarchaea archaeon]|nr:hypothetical protein [Candidatus Nanohaloarchaea archaeon]
MIFDNFNFIFGASFIGSFCFAVVYFVGFLISDARTQHLSKDDFLIEGALFSALTLGAPAGVAVFVYNSSLIWIAENSFAPAFLALFNTIALYYIAKKLKKMSNEFSLKDSSGFTFQKISLMFVVGSSLYIPATLYLQGVLSLALISILLPFFTISLSAVYFGKLSAMELPMKVVCEDKEYLGWKIDEDKKEISITNEEGLKRIFKSKVRSVEQPSEEEILDLIEYAQKSNYTIKSSFSDMPKEAEKEIKEVNQDDS